MFVSLGGVALVPAYEVGLRAFEMGWPLLVGQGCRHILARVASGAQPLRGVTLRM